MSNKKKHRNSNKQPVSKKRIPIKKKNSKMKTFAIIGFAVVIFSGIFIAKAMSGASNTTLNGSDSNTTVINSNQNGNIDTDTSTDLSKVTAVSTTGDIKIKKSDLSQTARFYPFKDGNFKMEVIAVKGTDGKIRTAFNTCQVCYNSGRGYYVQQGNELVCQNCGNRFNIDQVGNSQSGCNPVPVIGKAKTTSGSTITISKNYLVQNESLFQSWGKA